MDAPQEIEILKFVILLHFSIHSLHCAGVRAPSDELNLRPVIELTGFTASPPKKLNWLTRLLGPFYAPSLVSPTQSQSLIPTLLLCPVTLRPQDLCGHRPDDLDASPELSATRQGSTYGTTEHMGNYIVAI